MNYESDIKYIIEQHSCKYVMISDMLGVSRFVVKESGVKEDKLSGIAAVAKTLEKTLGFLKRFQGCYVLVFKVDHTSGWSVTREIDSLGVQTSPLVQSGFTSEQIKSQIKEGIEEGILKVQYKEQLAVFDVQRKELETSAGKLAFMIEPFLKAMMSGFGMQPVVQGGVPMTIQTNKNMVRDQEKDKKACDLLVSLISSDILLELAELVRDKPELVAKLPNLKYMV